MKGDRRTPLWVVCALALVGCWVVPSARNKMKRQARRRLFNSVNPICTMCTSMAVQMYSDDDWFPVANSEIEAMSMMVCSGTTNFTTPDAKEDQYRHFKDQGVLSAEYNPFRYVQGLKKDDPPDLIVMYVKKMTHWRTKRDSYEETPKWLVMGPHVESSYWAYEGGWIDTAEFTRRLRKTLDFLRANERPHWQETVKEHNRFLQQVKGAGEG